VKTIILTGGGTAGHAVPNLALVPRLRESGYEIIYIGRKDGVEKTLAEGAGLTYIGISSGKLRRYFKMKNFTDAFKVIKGVAEAFILVGRIKPDVIFSKGGFVAVPVVAAGWLRRVPVIIHESDLTCGLANKLSAPFASAICCTFPETVNEIKNKKAVYTGSPIRETLRNGDKNAGLKFCGFGGDKPVALVIGGSSGSIKINRIVRDALPGLLGKFQVAHICGPSNVDNACDTPGYKQFEYVRDELPHLFAAASIVVSRAGANTIMELLALKIPALLIPLPLTQSRGDQIKNAESFEKQGFAAVMSEDKYSEGLFINKLETLYSNRNKYIQNMEKYGFKNGTDIIIDLIKKTTGLHPETPS